MGVKYEDKIKMLLQTQYHTLQNKAIRVISFKDRNTAAEPLYNERKIIKVFDLVSFYNCLLIAEHINQNLPSSFGNYFTYIAECHNYNTRGA